MTTSVNIALTGKLRSGKSSVADYLTERYGYTQFAFGDELKRHYYEIFGQPADGSKPREGLQWFGQTMRERDNDVWVRKCFDNINDYGAHRYYDGEDPPKIVLTDVRQPNEIIRCRSEGYVIIRINAPESLRIHRAVESADTFNLRDLTHETEGHVDLFAVDYDVYNVGTLADLHAQIDAIMTKGEAIGCD